MKTEIKRINKNENKNKNLENNEIKLAAKNDIIAEFSEKSLPEIKLVLRKWLRIT